MGRCLSRAGGQSVGGTHFRICAWQSPPCRPLCPSCRLFGARQGFFLHSALNIQTKFLLGGLTLLALPGAAAEVVLGPRRAPPWRPFQGSTKLPPSIGYAIHAGLLAWLARPRWCSEAYGMALTWPAIRDRAPSLHSSSPFLFLFFVIREGRLDASEANDMWRAGRKEIE